MTDDGYRKRLAADLPKWLDAGWVTPEGAGAILASVEDAGAERRSVFGLATILGTLGAVLLGVGVLAFVGANWEALPRIVRLALIVAAMAIAYGAAFLLDKRGLRRFAEAGVLAAGLIYAGAIALVGQTYHMSGDFEAAVMLFEAGVLAAALFSGSPSMTVLALIGGGYWTWLATFADRAVPHFASLAAILVGVALATAQNSRSARMMAVLALTGWVAITVAGLSMQNHWAFVATLVLLFVAALTLWSLGALLASLAAVPKLVELGEALLWPGLLLVLVTLGVLQWAHMPWAGDATLRWVTFGLAALAVVLASAAVWRRGLAAIDGAAVTLLVIAALAFAMAMPADDLIRRLAGGAVVIVAAVWAVSLGQTGRHPFGKSLGLTAFGLEVLYLYIFTIGTRLDTAVAMLGGGALFVVLAWALYRLDRRMKPRTAPASEAAGEPS